ncbi:hypothetical protein [Cellulomonas phragmiteti]|uniref:Uncharacterized protein n=1 Tax=Cellulomonas phragmiteti TaxID=478780 RepID=A0ABQ4DM64_9CELL|nr:hypothetical protein [Cellulomonas phragmiteti]GIG40442.1 hypothetical protein Cph01nite_22040 [Cellulomonas phragmiteti]
MDGGDAVAAGRAPENSSSTIQEPSLALRVGRDLPFSPYADAIATVLGPDGTAQNEEEFLAREQVVADCMKREGFDYTPRPYVKSEDVAAGWAEGVVFLPVLPEDRAVVEQIGYGVDDVQEQERLLESAETPDENDAYLAGLSPSAQDAYVLALSGQDGPDDPAPDPGGGCVGEALREVADGGHVPAAADEFAPLIVAMRRVAQEAVYDDPRTVALNEEWTGCMLDAGFDVAPPESSAASWPAGPLQAYDLAVVTAADGSVERPGRDTPTNEIPLERRYLVGSDAERAVALADFDCRASTDYVERFVTVLADLESDFVATQGAALEQLVTAADSR